MSNPDECGLFSMAANSNKIISSEGNDAQFGSDQHYVTVGDVPSATFSQPPTITPPKRDPREWKAAAGIALLAATVLGVTLGVSLGNNSGSNGSTVLFVPAATASPLVGDSALALLVASLERDSIAKDTQIAGLSQSLTRALIRISAIEADSINKTSQIASLEVELATLRTSTELQSELQSELDQTVLEVSSAINRNTLSIDRLQNVTDDISSNAFDGWTFGDGFIPSDVHLSGAIALADHALLSGLMPHNIQGIDGYLTISNSNNLVDITGLTDLRSIEGSLSISSNNNLVNITGLTDLRSIGRNLYISSNTNLADITGLTDLRSIAGSLSINSNTNLVDISGLTNLTSIEGSLSISSNINLAHITGLSNLRRIEGTIYLRNNGNFNDYQSLQNLECHGGIYQDNPSAYCQGCPSWLITLQQCHE